MIRLILAGRVYCFRPENVIAVVEQMGIDVDSFEAAPETVVLMTHGQFVIPGYMADVVNAEITGN